MASGTRAAPSPKDPPPWAMGKISPFAFEALKKCCSPHGYAGRRDTMRRLVAKGFVRQIENGRYVATEDGIDIIEGRCRCPIDLSRASPLSAEKHTNGPWHSPKKAADTMQPSRPAVVPYTVKPILGGCHVIRPRFGAGPRLREQKP